MALRKTQNTLTHILQRGTAGTGAAHNAEDIAFDDTTAETGAATVQDAIEAVVTSVNEIPSPVTEASGITFDDTASETGETNLQAVIDSLVTRIAALEA